MTCVISLTHIQATFLACISIRSPSHCDSNSRREADKHGNDLQRYHFLAKRTVSQYTCPKSLRLKDDQLEGQGDQVEAEIEQKEGKLAEETARDQGPFHVAPGKVLDWV